MLSTVLLIVVVYLVGYGLSFPLISHLMKEQNNNGEANLLSMMWPISWPLAILVIVYNIVVIYVDFIKALFYNSEK